MWKPLAQADSFLRAQNQLQNSILLISCAYLREGSAPSFINSTEPALAPPAGDCSAFSAWHLVPVFDLLILDSGELWIQPWLWGWCLLLALQSFTTAGQPFLWESVAVVWLQCWRVSNNWVFSVLVFHSGQREQTFPSVFCFSVTVRGLTITLGYELRGSELLS